MTDKPRKTLMVIIKLLAQWGDLHHKGTYSIVKVITDENKKKCVQRKRSLTKGQCHEIFCFRVFPWNIFPQASEFFSNAKIFASQGAPPVSTPNQTADTLKRTWRKKFIFMLTLLPKGAQKIEQSCEYLREFLKNWFVKKNLKSKISWHCLFKL